MDAVTQQNAALVEEAAAATRALEAQSVQLVQAMAHFQVGQADQVEGWQSIGQMHFHSDLRGLQTHQGAALYTRQRHSDFSSLNRCGGGAVLAHPWCTALVRYWG